jgi:ATP-dependent Clp protease ATP-binding subunit ClpA
MSIERLIRFTSTARKGLSNAQQEATLEKSSTIDSRHLLIGLTQLAVSESTAAHVLNGLGATADRLQTGKQPVINEAAQLDLSENLRKIIERAVAAVQQRKEREIASAHLLFGALEDVAIIRILESMGTTRDKVSAALQSLDAWADEP